jgi:hypothetical protein
METFNLNNEHLVHPFEPKAVDYWTRKWGIKAQQLHEAILETGSIRPKVLRDHLAGKGLIFTWPGALRKLRKQIRILAAKFNGSYYEEPH